MKSFSLTAALSAMLLIGLVSLGSGIAGAQIYDPQVLRSDEQPVTDHIGTPQVEESVIQFGSPSATEPTTAAPSEVSPQADSTEPSKNAPSVSAEAKPLIKKQKWWALNVGSNRAQALQDELQRLKEERQEDTRQIRLLEPQLQSVRDELAQLEERWLALDRQIREVCQQILPELPPPTDAP